MAVHSKLVMKKAGAAGSVGKGIKKTPNKPAAAGSVVKGITKKPASSVSLTTTSLKKHEETTKDKIDKLNQKMAGFSKGDLTESDFNDDDKHKLWDRFHKQLRKNGEASSSFESIDGHGKQDKKCKMLFAWIKDPTWGKTFSNLTRPAVLLTGAVNIQDIYKA
jgi:hypothetical protein